MNVYPGHGIVVGMAIMNEYSSYAAAVTKGRTFPSALENMNICGSGGAVYAALDGLKLAVNSILTPREVVEHLNSHWQRHCDIPESLLPGQKEADEMTEEFVAKLETWCKG